MRDFLPKDDRAARRRSMCVAALLAAGLHGVALAGVSWAPASVMEAVETVDEGVVIELAAAPPEPPAPVEPPPPPPPPVEPPPPPPEPDPEPEPVPEPKPKPKPKPQPKPQPRQPRRQTNATAAVSTPVQAVRTAPSPKLAPVVTPPAASTSYKNPKPAYPPLARKRGQEGTVRVRAHIDEQGKLIDVSVAQSSGHTLLDDAALKTVRRWRFTPAMRDGQPVKGTIVVPIEFSLK